MFQPQNQSSDREAAPEQVPEQVPDQTKGKESDEANSTVYACEADAERAFRQTRAHMLDVNRWFRMVAAQFPGRTLGGLNPLVPVFSLTGKDSSASVGDVIRISAGGQDMFVKIEEITDLTEEFAIRVRPCDAEGNPAQSQHMYTPEATNTFCLRREGTHLINSFHGRNEVTNDSLLSLLADAGMILGGRHFNWTLLGHAWRPDPDQVSELPLISEAD